MPSVMDQHQPYGWDAFNEKNRRVSCCGQAFLLSSSGDAGMGIGGPGEPLGMGA